MSIKQIVFSVFIIAPLQSFALPSQVSDKAQIEYEVEDTPKSKWAGPISAAVGSIIWSNILSVGLGDKDNGANISELTGYLGAALSLAWTPFVADGLTSGIWNGFSNYLLVTMGLICCLGGER